MELKQSPLEFPFGKSNAKTYLDLINIVQLKPKLYEKDHYHE